MKQYEEIQNALKGIVYDVPSTVLSGKGSLIIDDQPEHSTFV